MVMPVNKPTQGATNGVPKPFRPSQAILDIFWPIAEGNDDQRDAGVKKLFQLIQEVEVKQRTSVLYYCKDRLIRGLSSGRKFARVGYSVALTHLLKTYSVLQTSEILESVKNKLQVFKHDKKSKAEIGGIYLGKAFAFSALIKSGRLSQMSDDDFRTVVEELMSMSQKKSYLKPVCYSIIEDIVQQISVDTFGESMWPQIRDSMKEGWVGCTLDKLSLLLVCREKFPDVVNKKFLKKHWDFPVLSQENDEKLLQAILITTTQKTEILLKKVIPSMLQNERDTHSIWQGLGAPLMKPLSVEKKETETQRHLLGLKLARALLTCSKEQEQVLELLLTPSLAHPIFHAVTQKSDPLQIEADSLFEQFKSKVKEEKINVQTLAISLWKMSAEEMKQNHKTFIITSPNFTHLLNLMEKDEAADFAEKLISAVKGTNKEIELSSDEKVKRRQVESCLRCLHHAVTSQDITSPELQKSALSLFLRLGFFHVNKPTSNIVHCESGLNLVDGQSDQKLCNNFFFKTLTQLFTMIAGSQKKPERVEEYMSLLFHLAQYMQELMKAKTVGPIQSWPEQMPEEWNKAYKMLTKIHKKGQGQLSPRDSAFLMLSLFLAFYMLVDFKTASELLQDIYVCCEKASQKKQESSGDVPPWQEVVTEVLLQLMSLPSHLGRIIACTVLHSLTSHLTVGAVQLITEVLIPKAARGDDAGGVMVEADDGEDESGDDDDDDDDLIDEDVPDEESDDDEDEDSDADNKVNEDLESEEEEEEEMQIDEKFRASVKEALGAAADESDGDEDEGDLSDMSDTEMFKLDDMLAEVFRQRKKASNGKKAREEKKKEMANFRIRVLDLVDVLVKSERCGDFVLEVVKPLLLIILKMDAKDHQALIEKSKAIFQHLKTKAKGLKDTLHDGDDHKDFLQELLELAQTVTEASHMSEIALSCHIVMNLNCGESKNPDSQCVALVEEAVQTVIMKGKSKPHLSFFSSLIETNVERYQFMFPMLVSCLRDSEVKTHGKMICCFLLDTLVKKMQRTAGDEGGQLASKIQEVTTVVSESIKDLQADDIKVMYTKDILNLALTILSKSHFLSQPPFGLEEEQHLTSIKSKLNTDLRRLANRFISNLQRFRKGKNTGSPGKKNKKKKQKVQQNGKENNGNTPTTQSKLGNKKKKRKMSDSGCGEVSVDEMPAKKKAKH